MLKSGLKAVKNAVKSSENFLADFITLQWTLRINLG